ncbi:hypothetical protein [Oceanisphaera avium]|uniref:DUF4157 domain-containing protein n=1 Tax=Oceanisphaera avium TaxID=1903694 RepID=A0A1Y0CZV7_9GAMM|nr:hypothetical protein [Oceanisphaera avium]ART80862.1 hypothetical protein CBP12_12435 [Oceanisphaera avium]
MINHILDWVNNTNAAHASLRHSCQQLSRHFSGFFEPELFTKAGFVITSQLPSPPISQVAHLGLTQLLSPTAVGITLNDTYYIKPKVAAQLSVHFHELIHVLQWQALGPSAFIERYISEVLHYGYRQAPLEEKAYGYEGQFKAQPNQPFVILASDTL